MFKDEENVYAIMPIPFCEKVVAGISQALLSMKTDKTSDPERIRLAEFYLTQILTNITHAPLMKNVELNAQDINEPEPEEEEFP